MIKWIATFLAIVATVGIVFQWRAINRLRAENAALQAAETASNENVSLGRGMTAIKSYRDNTELLRLRNEVGQLRSRLPELAKARAENEALLAESKTARQTNSNTVPEGFLGKEQLANVGQASPEAVLQTFFAAMRDGNLELLAQCASPQLAGQLGLNRLKPNDPAQTEQLRAAQAQVLRAALMQQMDSFTNMRIVNSQPTDDGKVVLSVQSNPRGSIAAVTVVNLDNVWRVDKLF